MCIFSPYENANLYVTMCLFFSNYFLIDKMKHIDT